MLLRVLAAFLVARGVQGACDSSHPWCSSFTSESPPSDYTSHMCHGETSCISSLADWQIQTVVAQHNLYRAEHGVCPMTYNSDMASYTVGSAGFLQTCNTGSLTHNSGSGYGESIAAIGLPSSSFEGLHVYDPAEGVKRWYCGEEGCYNYSKTGSQSGTSHMTQVVWKSSLEIGCALCQRQRQSSNFMNVYLMCTYKDAGNDLLEMADNVLNPNTATACVPTTPAPTAALRDECAATPCDADQDCNDPDQAVDKDYTCTCKDDASITVTGKAAVCTTDECASGTPCGSGQDCVDTKQVKSLGDYTCTCQSDNKITNTGGPATCDKDECQSDPCDAANTQQTCTDPDQSSSSTGDYKCKCTNGVEATGGKATCEIDECVAKPCGATGQTCVDKDKASNKKNDFECTCDADNTIKNTGAAATCDRDECAADPCKTATTQQTCVDMSQGAANLNDYVCTCTNGVSATGGQATCEIDECDAKPCGATGQTCVDGNKAADKKKDFTCTCDADNTIKNTGAAATCDRDECSSDPCDKANTQQTCTDPNQSSSSTGDYKCKCTNGVEATGGKATCEIDECVAKPCGAAGQTCVDKDKASNKKNDFECTCDADNTIKNTGAPATCTKDEGTSSPTPVPTVVPTAVPTTTPTLATATTPQPSAPPTSTPQTCTVPDTISGPCAASLPCHMRVMHPQAVRSVAFSADGTLMATASEDGVRVFDSTTGTQVVHGPLACTAGLAVRDVAFAPDGEALAVGGVSAAGGRAVVCNTTTGDLQYVVQSEGSAPVRRVVFSADGDLVVSAGGAAERTRLVHASTGTTALVLHEHSRDVALSPDGSLVATVTGSGALTKVWNTATGELLGQVVSAAEVRSVVFRSGAELLIGTEDGAVSLVQWASGAVGVRVSLPSGLLLQATASPDGQFFAACSAVDAVVWTADGRVHSTLRLSSVAHEIAFSPDSSSVAVAGHDGSLLVWSV